MHTRLWWKTKTGADACTCMRTLHIHSWQQEVFSSIGDGTLLENTTADNMKNNSGRLYIKKNEQLKNLTLEPPHTIIGFFLHWEYVTKLGHQQMTTLHIYSWQQEVFSSIGDRTLLENTTADNLKHILDQSTYRKMSNWSASLWNLHKQALVSFSIENMSPN